MMNMQTWDDLRSEIARTYPNADIVPTVIIPWGEAEHSGMMVDTDGPLYRVGVYSDLSTGDESLAIIEDIPTAAMAWCVLDHLTENQPEGTDWTAWAAHWCDEVWPDVRDAP